MISAQRFTASEEIIKKSVARMINPVNNAMDVPKPSSGESMVLRLLARCNIECTL